MRCSFIFLIDVCQMDWDENQSAPSHISCLFRRGSFKKLTKQIKLFSYSLFYKD
ncbi:hypothetical protein NEIFLAOT_02554 [Neisseria flavescens NRL30031/H210]|uniref:Uncharacterized protein n=1 Tax=Neisseria flavescens NRL30031/H210 TaxID=546264 RepID=C0ERF3_NEIFL|nr:hypothetical protein NEIFLAOT_02554 [Neisseria flavescens NRL30031/H210]